MLATCNLFASMLCSENFHILQHKKAVFGLNPPMYISLLPPISSFLRADTQTPWLLPQHTSQISSRASPSGHSSPDRVLQLKNIMWSNCFFYECCFTIWSWKFTLLLILSGWSLVYFDTLNWAKFLIILHKEDLQCMKLLKVLQD